MRDAALTSPTMCIQMYTFIGMNTCSITVQCDPHHKGQKVPRQRMHPCTPTASLAQPVPASPSPCLRQSARMPAWTACMTWRTGSHHTVPTRHTFVIKPRAQDPLVPGGACTEAARGCFVTPANIVLVRGTRIRTPRHRRRTKSYSPCQGTLDVTRVGAMPSRQALPLQPPRATSKSTASGITSPVTTTLPRITTLHGYAVSWQL